jgi:hypothetical protein
LKRLLFILVIALTTLQVYGHENRKFDPKKFEVELEQFIVTEAALTPQEASAFFPVYKEMQRKQRMLYNKVRSYRHVDIEDEKSSLEAIKNRDELEVQIKKLQQQYHLKFCKILPAKKVLRIIRAEEKFHRQAFRRATKRK